MLAACLCALALHSIPIHAQAQVRYVRYSNGTGFYVTKEGHIITNAHVVAGCKNTVQVSNAAGSSEAAVIARADAVDLALLKARDYAPSVATLRRNGGDIRSGEVAIVMGYAGMQGANGRYSFVKSQILSTVGPTGEAHWLQFANSTQRGNSGGPLLDVSGNVIGVITGKTRLERTDGRVNVAPVTVAEADVAVNLATLNRFLEQMRVRPSYASSGMLGFADQRLEHQAKSAIVQLKCETD